MIELKPCPFCGGTDLHIESFSGWGADVIICDKCLSIFSQQEITCEEDLVAAWNRRADGWRDSETDPPKEGIMVIVADNIGGVEIAFRERALWKSRKYGGRYISHVTHWMPIPEPPKERR